LKPLALVVAIAEGGVIGFEGALPWHIPEDLAHFKAVTIGHAIIMGRRTHASIGRPLPGRRNIVVSRSVTELAGCDVAASLDEAIAMAREADLEPRIIGGAEIYVAALPSVTRVFLTEVQQPVRGDAWLLLDRSPFREVSRRAGERSAVSFVELERREFQD
jgi:dihydrofolate reductase